MVDGRAIMAARIADLGERTGKELVMGIVVVMTVEDEDISMLE